MHFQQVRCLRWSLSFLIGSVLCWCHKHAVKNSSSVSFIYYCFSFCFVSFKIILSSHCFGSTCLEGYWRSVIDFIVTPWHFLNKSSKRISTLACDDVSAVCQILFDCTYIQTYHTDTFFLSRRDWDLTRLAALVKHYMPFLSVAAAVVMVICPNIAAASVSAAEAKNTWTSSE